MTKINLAQINRNVDLINVMAYDYSGGWSTRTGMSVKVE